MKQQDIADIINKFDGLYAADGKKTKVNALLGAMCKKGMLNRQRVTGGFLYKVNPEYGECGAVAMRKKLK